MEPLHIVCPHCDTINRLDLARIQHAPKCGKCKQALFEAHPIDLSASNFDRHLSRNDIPVVVDFWAPWCAPCKMMAPAFKQAAAQLEPKLRLAKLNTEQEPSIAARYAIRSIPTLVVFKSGREIARHSGAMGNADIVRWIESVV